MLSPGLIFAAFIILRYERLSHVRVRMAWLIVVMAILQFLYVNDHYPARWSAPIVLRVVAATSLALLAAFATVNRRDSGRPGRWGLAFTVGGAVANAVPQLIHGAMPYSTASARLAGFPADALISQGKHLEATGVSLPVLAMSDVVPLPVLDIVFSVGDFLLLVGVSLFLIGLAHAEPRCHSSSGRHSMKGGELCIRQSRS